MSYLVVARKWRPQRFEDIAGQGHITRTLTNAIRGNRIAHAYLFSGIRGVGKTTAARILAKSLNCIHGPTPTPCNECVHCNEISAGNCMDVYEIDGASNRGIDEVRQIIENVRYLPAQCRFKIYIIDEVHQVTKDAFNALLKTLEEPPPSVKFILATTEPHRLPETILSRCQRFDFRRISMREIVQRLKEIAESEGLRMTEGALLIIAREADGSMRDAQSLLEQILSYVGPGSGEEKPEVEIEERLLEDILGIATRTILYEISEAVVKGESKRCVELLAKVAQEGLDIARLCRDLVEHFRNLLVVRLAQEKNAEVESYGARASTPLVDLPDQEIEYLRQQAADLSVETLMDYFNFLADGDEALAHSAYPRFALEALLVRLATLPKTMSVADALERLENLERKLAKEETKGSASPVTQEYVDTKGSRVKSLAPESASDETLKIWRTFVDFVMKEKRFLGSHLEKVRPLEIVSGRLKIGVEDRHHLSYLKDAENLAFLRELAQRFFSRETSVTVSPWTSNASVGDSVTDRPGDPKNLGQADMVKEAMRIFGGSVKEHD